MTNMFEGIYVTVWVSDETEFMVSKWKGLEQIKADGGLKSWPRQFYQICLCRDLIDEIRLGTIFWTEDSDDELQIKYSSVAEQWCLWNRNRNLGTWEEEEEEGVEEEEEEEEEEAAKYNPGTAKAGPCGACAPLRLSPLAGGAAREASVSLARG